MIQDLRVGFQVSERRACQVIGISRSSHRYFAAQPGDLVGLAALLGHGSLDTTRIYVEPTAAQLAQRVEEIDLNAYTV